MNMFRCGDMMVRNVAHVDESLFPLVGRTFDRVFHDGWLDGLVWRVFIEVAGYPAFWSNPF
jgi:hypothetical protein